MDVIIWHCQVRPRCSGIIKLLCEWLMLVTAEWHIYCYWHLDLESVAYANHITMLPQRHSQHYTCTYRNVKQWKGSKSGVKSENAACHDKKLDVSQLQNLQTSFKITKEFAPVVIINTAWTCWHSIRTYRYIYVGWFSCDVSWIVHCKQELEEINS